MEPDALFRRFMYQWIRKLSQLAGADVFLINYKPSTLTYTNVITLFVFLVSCLWTIYSYEFDDKIICIAALSFCLQGIVKYYSVLTNSKELKDLADFSMKIYSVNTESGPNKTCLKKSIEITVFIFKYGLLMLITTAILTSIRPYISYILGGKLEPILPTYLPGMNEAETTGYITLTAFHLYILVIFVIGTAATDLALMTLVIHCHTMSLIFDNTVTKFNSLIRIEKKRNISNTSLKNLILMHNDFIKYTRMVETTYSNICLVQITMANTIMIVLIYVILMVDWFPAYFLMATAFFQVFEYSILGTIVEITNDKVYNTILTIRVEDLPIREQKQVILMVLLAQYPHNLTIGGFKHLNVETFIDSMKRTYSVGMLLLNTNTQ